MEKQMIEGYGGIDRDWDMIGDEGSVFIGVETGG